MLGGLSHASGSAAGEGGGGRTSDPRAGPHRPVMHSAISARAAATLAGLNFGDCFAYALAKTTGESLLFNGNDFGPTSPDPVVVTRGAGAPAPSPLDGR